MMGKRYWDDLRDGEHLYCRPFSFTQDEIIEFAVKYDPQPFHVDTCAASYSLFGGIIASSLQTLSAGTRVVVDAQGDLAIVSGLGMDEIKIPNPVRPNDLLLVEACWTGLRRSQSRPGHGIAGIRCKTVNQRGDTVMEFGFWYLVACRTWTEQLER